MSYKQYTQNKEDNLLFSKIIDKLTFCEKKHKTAFTDFIPIMKYNEFLAVHNQYINCNTSVFGGKLECERVIIGFFPSYVEPDFDKFPICTIEIIYNEKYSKELNHRAFLGSILGLGIDRSKIGDIIIDGNRAICFATTDIADYINSNLEKVSSTKVKTKIINIKDINLPEPKFEEKVITVISTRIDVVLAGAFNMSRSKISDIIKSEKAFVNFGVEQNISKILNQNDLVTLRGYGRIKIKEIGHQTKKNKTVITILKYI